MCFLWLNCSQLVDMWSVNISSFQEVWEPHAHQFLPFYFFIFKSFKIKIWYKKKIIYAWLTWKCWHINKKKKKWLTAVETYFINIFMQIRQQCCLFWVRLLMSAWWSSVHSSLWAKNKFMIFLCRACFQISDNVGIHTLGGDSTERVLQVLEYFDGWQALFF